MKLEWMGWVALGGALGAVARVASCQLFDACGLHGRFPWGTLFVNVLGCFLLGYLSAPTSQVGNLVPTSAGELSPSWRMLLGPGFLGGFTTFSTFSVETLQAWEQHPYAGLLNVGLNVGLGLTAAALGCGLSRLIHSGALN